jgi:hypothetical protein
MDRALRVVLSTNGTKPEPRTIIFLIDATPSLAKTGFVNELEGALAENAKQLGKALIGIASVGETRLTLSPTNDHRQVVLEMQALLRRGKNSVRNIYGSVRRFSGMLRGQQRRKDMVLVTLENGDAEDDLPGSVAALRASRVRLSVIARESYLADSYWNKRKRYLRNTRSVMVPKDCEMIGGDNAFIDMPWGWLFQVTTINEVIPSGFAAYGLTRLAAATKGVVCLYSPPGAAKHVCAVYGQCLFCEGDHIPNGEAYSSHKLAKLAPKATSRKVVYRDAARSPYHRATTAAWRAAAKAGVLFTTPSLRLAGTTALEDRNRGGRDLEFFRSLALERHARKAEDAADECTKIINRLEGAISKASKQQPPDRHRAMAMLTRFYLYLTRTNLISFAGWCREDALNIVERIYLPDPPEIPIVGDDEKIYSINYTNLCLCHGVQPFFAVRLPGGKDTRRELLALHKVVREFMREYRDTPYAVAVHRAGLARFSMRHGGGPRPRRRPSSKAKKGPLTDGRGRPPRKGGATTGGAASGPTTGK